MIGLSSLNDAKGHDLPRILLYFNRGSCAATLPGKLRNQQKWTVNRLLVAVTFPPSGPWDRLLSPSHSAHPNCSIGERSSWRWPPRLGARGCLGPAGIRWPTTPPCRGSGRCLRHSGGSGLRTQLWHLRGREQDIRGPRISISGICGLREGLPSETNMVCCEIKCINIPQCIMSKETPNVTSRILSGIIHRYSILTHLS